MFDARKMRTKRKRKFLLVCYGYRTLNARHPSTHRRWTECRTARTGAYSERDYTTSISRDKFFFFHKYMRECMEMCASVLLVVLLLLLPLNVRKHEFQVPWKCRTGTYRTFSRQLSHRNNTIYREYTQTVWSVECGYTYPLCLMCGWMETHKNIDGRDSATIMKFFFSMTPMKRSLHRVHLDGILVVQFCFFFFLALAMRFDQCET